MSSTIDQHPASRQPSIRASVVAGALSAAVVASLIIGAAAFTLLGASTAPVSTVRQGSFTIYYTLLDRPGGDSAWGTKTIPARRIEYFATYVLVTLEDNQTRLWPVDRLKQFDVLPAPEEAGPDSK